MRSATTSESRLGVALVVMVPGSGLLRQPTAPAAAVVVVVGVGVGVGASDRRHDVIRIDRVRLAEREADELPHAARLIVLADGPRLEAVRQE